MNKDTLEGDWKQVKGTLKQQWGKLTDDQVTEVNGSREKLSGALQKSYGVAKDEAEKQINEWEKASRKNNAA